LLTMAVQQGALLLRRQLAGPTFYTPNFSGLIRTQYKAMDSCRNVPQLILYT